MLRLMSDVPKRPFVNPFVTHHNASTRQDAWFYRRARSRSPSRPCPPTPPGLNTI